MFCSHFHTGFLHVSLGSQDNQPLELNSQGPGTKWYKCDMIAHFYYIDHFHLKSKSNNGRITGLPKRC